jgi:hypothetical protein
VKTEPIFWVVGFIGKKNFIAVRVWIGYCIHRMRLMPYFDKDMDKQKNILARCNAFAKNTLMETWTSLLSM